MALMRLTAFPARLKARFPDAAVVTSRQVYEAATNGAFPAVFERGRWHADEQHEDDIARHFGLLGSDSDEARRSAA